MQLSNIGHASMVTGAKFMILAASPFQKVFDHAGTTHEFLNRQAIKILKSDGCEQYADFLSSYLAELNAGVYWADRHWKNVSHYFEIPSGKGLWRFSNALESFQEYHDQAVCGVRRGDFSQGVFYLGAAAHLLQDVCVPHHARIKLFSGHKEYECWVQERCIQYSVSAGGIYNRDDITKILVNNATAAGDLFDWINLDRGMRRYHKVTELLLPLAQRSTAGLFQQFCAVTEEVMSRKIMLAM